MKSMIRNTKFNSFLGQSMYDLLVPENHFLRRLNGLVDWVDLSQGIFQVYKGEFRLGAAAISPVTMLKMLLLSYLYNLSDRDTERLCNENITFKYFIEISLDQSAPDHSSLSVFRDRILKHYGNTQYFVQLFEKVVQIIAEHPEIKFGSSQIIDATHIEAKVRAKKEQSNNTSDHTDTDARWGCKGSEEKKDVAGNVVKIPKFFFGYKKHSSIENKHRFVTSSMVSSGEKPDGDFFQDLTSHDLSMRGHFEGSYADKAYDDGEHHVFLNELELQDGIVLKETRFKEDANHAIWHMIAGTEFYQQKGQERYKVEAMQADQKNNHGLRRCRYLGLQKTRMQGYLTDVAYNFKKMLKVLYNISPRQVAA